MSVVARNLMIRNEVETMSSTSISQDSCTTATRRPVVDVLAEKLARRLLAWSAQRQEARSQRVRGPRVRGWESGYPSHDRMALIRENEYRRASVQGAIKSYVGR
jgi:hypothetical protein